MAKYLDYNGLSYFWSKLKAKFATIASPTFTGTPTAPTPSSSTNSTQIATTAYVRNLIDGKSFAYYGESATSTVYDGSANPKSCTLSVTTVNQDYANRAGNVITIRIKTDFKPSTTVSDYYRFYLNIDGVTKEFKVNNTEPNDNAIKSGMTLTVIDDGTIYQALSIQAQKTPTNITGAVGGSLGVTPLGYYNTLLADGNVIQLAGKEYVDSEIASSITGASKFQGTVSAQSTITNSSYKRGWYWVVATAGTYVGEVCEVGDMIFAINDKASSYSASDFSVVQNNIETITNGEIDTIVAS